MKPTKTFLAPAGFLTAFLLFSLAVPGARAQVNIDQIKLGTGNGHTIMLESSGVSTDEIITLPSVSGTLITDGNLSSITAVGTITSGTWNGGVIGPTYGGTGLNSYLKGDLLYASAANTLAALAGATTDGWVLTWNNTSGLPEWRLGGGLAHITETYNNSTSPYSSGNGGEELAASGTDANISIALQPKGFGALEAQIADGTATGGNARGWYAVDWQMSRFANTDVASGLEATVSGGRSNTASGAYATVSGGLNNTASNTYATVSGGDNTASGAFATVSGGYSNTASGSGSTITGGTSNTASNTGATVSGGNSNTASNIYATVSGGELNTASNTYAAVSGGVINTASGLEATVSGGYTNTASGNYSTVSGGYTNTASGNYSTVSGGLGAVASQYGQHAQASGEFASAGDAQTSVYTERIATSSATGTAMALDGGTTQLAVPSNTTWAYKILVSARNDQGATGTSDTWEILGMVANNAGTLTNTGAPTHLGATAWNVGTSVSGTNLVITVTGAAATNIRWVARVETAEVTY